MVWAVSVQQSANVYYKEGFKVIVGCSSDSSRKDAWAASQREAGYEFEFIYGDVTDWESTRKAFEMAREQFGPIDVLVNNAGITRDASFRKLTPEDWNSGDRDQPDGLFNTTKQVIEGMLAKVGADHQYLLDQRSAWPVRPDQLLRAPRPASMVSPWHWPGKSPARA